VSGTVGIPVIHGREDVNKSAPEGFVFAHSERGVVVGSVVRWQVNCPAP
jgi:hypothetical protein